MKKVLTDRMIESAALKAIDSEHAEHLTLLGLIVELREKLLQLPMYKDDGNVLAECVGDPSCVLIYARRNFERQLRAQLEAEYLQAGGSFCPICKSSDITGGSIDMEGSKVYQTVSCLECGASWVDEFTLTGVDIDENQTDH